jgi:hypothetical protein
MLAQAKDNHTMWVEEASHEAAAAIAAPGAGGSAGRASPPVSQLPVNAPASGAQQLVQASSSPH